MLCDKSQAFDPGSSGVLSGERLLKTRGILWATCLFAVSFGSLVASISGDTWLHLRGDVAYVPSIVVPVLTCSLYTLLVHRFEKRKAWEFQVSSTTVFEVVLGFVFGAAFIAAMWGLLYAIGMYSVHRGVWTRWFADFVFDSYVSAVVEEIAFRAVLFRIFARLWGVRNGVLLSSLLFGIAHITHGSWLGVMGIAINGGITMALLYVITGRFWMSMGMHLGYDFIETSILGVSSDHGFLISKPESHAPWLTGGSFGPDAAIPAMLMGLLINVILWRLAVRSRSNWGTHRQQSSSVATQIF